MADHDAVLQENDDMDSGNIFTLSDDEDDSNKDNINKHEDNDMNDNDNHDDNNNDENRAETDFENILNQYNSINDSNTLGYKEGNDKNNEIDANEDSDELIVIGKYEYVCASV